MYQPWLAPFIGESALPPAIFLGSIKVDGLEGGSAIIVGPSVSTGGPAAGVGGAAAAGGEGEAGRGGEITLTNVRGDFANASVGCALIIQGVPGGAAAGEARGQGAEARPPQTAPAGQARAEAPARAAPSPQAESAGQRTPDARRQAAEPDPPVVYRFFFPGSGGGGHVPARRSGR